MSNQVTLKVKFGSDIRKAVFPSSEINSYSAITRWINEIYNLNDSTSFLLKYMDGDGELVTFTNDDDLHLALTTEPLLYVHVFSGGNDANSVVSQLLKEFDTLKHTMDNLKIMIEDNASYFTQTRHSRSSSPVKAESVATIQPSVHEEIDHNGVARIVSSETKQEPTEDFSHHDENQRMENIPIDQHSSHSPHQQHQHNEQHQQLPPHMGNNQQFIPTQNSGFVPPSGPGFPQTAFSNQQQPSQQQFRPPSVQKMPPQHEQLQQGFPGMPPPTNGAPQQHQQQQPSHVPPQSGTPQHFAPPPLNGGPQQQQPNFPPQSGTPQHFAPPPNSGFAPTSQPSPFPSQHGHETSQMPPSHGINGMHQQYQQQPPQQQQPPNFPPQSGTPQHFAPPTNAGFAPPPTSGFAPPIKQLPGQQQFQQSAPGAPPLGPPPTNFAGGPPSMGPAGLANPFARPQMPPQQRPGSFNNY